MFRLLTFCLTVLAMAISLPASEDAYLRDIKPLLAHNCYSCHGALKQQAGLRLDTVEFMRTGGEKGAVIIPGNGADSLLVQRVSSADPEQRMPQESKGLNESEILMLTRWINDGARAPQKEQAEADPRSHWAFRKPVRPEVPPFGQGGAGGYNPIDSFVASVHRQRGLSPQPKAEAVTLLRRVYVDLIGVPPTRDEVRAFVSDRSLRAYENSVDNLLNDPRYGERWARHWMDIWRYSDWYGRRSQKDVRNSYPHIWRWRDWIVRSLNEDKGYDRMVMEMLAADELTPDDNDTLVATGFIARNWFSLNTDQWMKDLVEHTGKAFLGLTLNCAHCHDHKYDPIAQKEYFAFRAFFEPLQMRHDRVPGGGPLKKLIPYGMPGAPNPRAAIDAGMIRVFDEKLDAKTIMYLGGDARNKLTNQPPINPAAPAILNGVNLKIATVDLPVAAWYPGLREAELGEDLQTLYLEIEKARKSVTATTPLSGDSPDRRLAEAALAAAEGKLKSLKARTAVERARHIDGAKTADELAATAGTAERRANQLAARHLVLVQQKILADATDKAKATKDATAKKKADASVKKAGQVLANAKKALTKAEAALKSNAKDYEPLSPTYPKSSTGRRTALAEWIANTENPLTARVAVNHIWARHFHQPIVDPVYDFGRNGGKPVFPALLDWLAVEFMESGWSMKQLHRLLVTSRAYRMDSRSVPQGHANLDIDPDNRFLWRMRPHRMEAEVIRDSILHTAGQMDRIIGGPELANTGADVSPRRSLYFETFAEGGGHSAFIALFDAPDPCDCYQRTESLVPQQALALVNSRLAINQARRLAGDLSRTSGPNDADFIVGAFESVLSRPPTVAERTACESFLLRQQNLYQGKDLKALGAKRLSKMVAGSVDPQQRSREGLVQSLFSHNEFVNVR
jgi:hypothetical protein